MTKIRNDKLTIPLDFEIACMLNKLKISRVLQLYINQISVSKPMNMSQLYKLNPAIPTNNNIDDLKINKPIITIKGKSCLYISKDLHSLCCKSNCHPYELLEYFMKKISLSEYQAKLGIGMPIENPEMSFFQMIIRGLVNAKPCKVHLSDEHIDYIEALQEVHLYVHIIRDVEKRQNVYEQFYNKHYLIFKTNHSNHIYGN